MADYRDRDTNMMYALNTYVWKVLEANLGYSKTDYRDTVPIIPRQQVPEYLEIAKPFIVYGSAQHPSTDFWGVKRESVAYNVYSTSTTTSDGIINLLTNVLERQDEAAADINQHLDDLVSRSGDTARKITFGSVRVTVTNDSSPSDEEGGFYSSLLMLDVIYTIYPVIKTTGFSYAATL